MLPLNPPPPQPAVDPKEVFTNTLWQRWFSSLYNRILKCLVKDYTSKTAPSNVATVAYTLPAAGVGMYMVSCNIGAVGDAANWGIWGIIAKDGATSRILTSVNTATHTLSVSGLSILVTQNTSGVYPLNITVVQIG